MGYPPLELRLRLHPLAEGGDAEVGEHRQRVGDDGAAGGVGVDVADGVQVGLGRDGRPSGCLETLAGRASLAFFCSDKSANSRASASAPALAPPVLTYRGCRAGFS